MRKNIIALSFVLINLIVLNAWGARSLISDSLSTPILYDSSAYGLPADQRTPLANAPGGLVATAAWYDWGMRLDWSVIDNGNGTYTYHYYFGPGWYPPDNGSGGTGTGGGNPYVTNKNMTAWEIQLGSSMTLNDLSNVSWNVYGFDGVKIGSGGINPDGTQYWKQINPYGDGIDYSGTEATLAVGELKGETGYTDLSDPLNPVPHYTLNSLFHGLRWINIGDPNSPGNSLFPTGSDVNYDITFTTSYRPGWGNFFSNSTRTGSNNNNSDVIALDSSLTGYDSSKFQGPVNLNNSVSTPGTTETSAPAVNIGPPSVSLTRSGPVTYNISYSDDNFFSVNLAPSNITLVTSSTANGSINLSGSGNNRTVTVNNITGDGTLGISINAGTAVDVAGNSAPASGLSTTFDVDNTPPSVSIGLPSSAATSSGPVTYTVTYADTHYDSSTLSVGNISLIKTGTADGTVSVSPLGSERTVTISNITGSGTLAIKIAAGTAFDMAGNLAPAAGPSTTFIVDKTAPETTITSNPPNPTNSGAASFSFTATKSGSTFRCSLDGSAFASCTSPATYTGLADGNHTFSVTATDSLGNTDPTPASFSWMVDATPPVTTAAPAGGTFGTAQSVTLSCSDAGGSGCSRIYYSTDGSTPTTLSSVYSSAISIPASATLKYFATDLAGNSETVKTQTYTIDTTTPETTITSNPQNPTNSGAASFSFTATKSGSTFRCSLDGSAFASCTSPATFSGLADGNHTFSVTATDSLGNTDPTPASFSWMVDATPPVTTAAPAGGTFGTAQSVTLSCSDVGGSGCNRIYYTTDGSTPTTLSSVYSSAISIPASATLKYFATDLAGNSETVKTQTYTIDTTTPTTTALPSGGTYSSAQSVTLTCVDNTGGSGCAATYICSDAVCASETLYSSPVLITGQQTIWFRSVDNAGNLEPVQSATYIVDGTSPTVAVSFSPAGPLGRGPYKAGTAVIISATFSEPINAATTPLIALSGADSLPPTQMSCDSSTHCTYSYTAGTGTGNVAVRITAATDMTGNAVVTVPVSGADFTIDNAPPTMQSTNPIDSASDIAVNATITATFDEQFDATTVNGSTFSLNKSGGPQVSGTVSYDSTNKIAIFTPSGGSLDYGTKYTATISGVKDLAGNTLASTKTWIFTTASTPDISPPVAVSTSPSNDETGVDIKTRPTVIFSESLSSIDSSGFTISSVNGEVTGTVNYYDTDSNQNPIHTAIFTPDNPLSYNTKYTATLKSGIKDLSGNATTSDYTWTFTTAPLYGDLTNTGGTVSIEDALLELQIAAGLVKPTDQQFASGDVAPMINGAPHPDGKIDISDVVAILMKLVGSVTW